MKGLLGLLSVAASVFVISVILDAFVIPGGFWWTRSIVALVLGTTVGFLYARTIR